MLRAALALLVVAAVAWAGAMVLGSAGADDELRPSGPNSSTSG